MRISIYVEHNPQSDTYDGMIWYRNLIPVTDAKSIYDLMNTFRRILKDEYDVNEEVTIMFVPTKYVPTAPKEHE